MIISCCPKGLHGLDGTHDFIKADSVVGCIEIVEVNATSARVPLLE